MADSTIKYSVLKQLDIANAMESCGKVAKNERSNLKMDGKVWENTVTGIMENLEPNKYEADTSKEGITKIREYLFTVLEKVIYDNKVVIPETGYDRTGKTIVLLNPKTNTTKWSSWDKSRRMFSYSGDIAKVLAYDKGATLYPEENKVAARCDILNECKALAPALEHVKRLTGQIEGYLPQLEGADKVEGLGLISTLVIPKVGAEIEAATLMIALERVLSGATADEKEVIRSEMGALATRHFTPKVA